MTSGPGAGETSPKRGAAENPFTRTPVKRERIPDGASQEDGKEDEVEEGGRSREATPELDEHYVTLRTDVVGVQYYTGMVGRGEYVMLRRQPHNQYDKNAIQVVNASGAQVGHVPRAVAQQLAYLVDSRLITVEGRMVGQNLDNARHYKLGMDLSIYAKPSHRPALEPELVWATPGQRGFQAMRDAEAAEQSSEPSSSQGKGKGKFKGKGRVLGGMGTSGGGSGVGLPGAGAQEEEVRRLLDGLKKVGEGEQQAEGVMDALTADIDVSRLPMHPDPPSLENGQLLTDLLPHQSQALQWMLSRENPKLPSKTSDPPVQFWVRQPSEQKNTRDYWLNVATRTPQVEEPVLGKGGIIADGMGLGKTLSMLSLILATKRESSSAGFSGATLVVCPLSILGNWEKQMNDHVAFGQLCSYTYHGAGRGVTAATLSNYDVILTTYQTVALDSAGAIPTGGSPQKGKKVKTSVGPLMKVKWKRVIADEGHILKNPKAKMTQAFAALDAERRWVCTGTPIVNSPSDLGSLLTCLRVCKPLDQAEYFKTLLLRPLRTSSPQAAKLLQALVAQILLRRTKESRDSEGKKLVDLPPLEFFQVEVSLDEETKNLYREVEEAGRRRFQEALSTGEGAANVLSLLTRMRQLCLSRDLVPASFIADLTSPLPPKENAHATKVDDLDPERRKELLDKLREWVADGEDCGICFCPVEHPRITTCGHCFCLNCISEWLSKHPNCPNDRGPLGPSSLIELPPDESEFPPIAEDTLDTEVKSAKIDELVKFLHAFDRTDKTLVFSQFTSFLDRVAGRLRKEGIRFCRFDGSLPAKQRQEVITAFQRPVSDRNLKSTPVVMLISLKSGAVGLNLTAASNVFLCDPWWQSAIEAQAIDRVHRMGQKKTVRVFQLIAEGTIESKVLDIQKRKDALVAKAFEKSSQGQQSRQARKQARFEEMQELFGVR